MSAAKEERQTLERTLADQAVQLSTLQTQLSSAKAAYETEVSLLSTLKDRRSTQLTEIQKTREELIRAESDLSAIRVEKSEIEGVFLRDKEEARDLHRRMVETGQQADALKAEVEKLKKEAKQQRGLLAIARKQLSTKEAEKAKAEKDHEEAVVEVMSLNEEKNILDADIAAIHSMKPGMASLASSESLNFAAAQPLPVTPDLSQSVKTSNNPFEILAKTSTLPTSRSQSPFLGLQNAALVSSPTPLASVNGTISHPLGAEATPVDKAEKQPTVNSEQISLPANDTSAPLQIEATPERALSSSPTEHFVTPPTSAIRSDSTSSAAVKFPALENIPAPFTSAPKALPSTTLPPSSTEETDLSSQLEELSAEDSESEDESEVEDSKPLSNGNIDPVAALPVHDGRDSSTIVDTGPLQSDLGPFSGTDLFDEIFETTTPPPQTRALADEETPLDKPKTPLDGEVERTPRVAGVDEFDKTLNNIPAPSSSATDPTDFFADSFGESFDFAAAKVEFPTALANPTTQTQEQRQTGSTFDNVFGTSGLTAPVVVPTIPPQGTFDTSFNDIFDRLDAGPSTSGNKPEAESSPASPAFLAYSASPVPSNEDSMPGAFPSQPVSPITSIISAEKEKDIKSLPGRVGSPKPRIVSPTKETGEKPKEVPHRHRLSVSTTLVF